VAFPRLNGLGANPTLALGQRINLIVYGNR
jgi:hypothetical protein